MGLSGPSDIVDRSLSPGKDRVATYPTRQSTTHRIQARAPTSESMAVWICARQCGQVICTGLGPKPGFSNTKPWAGCTTTVADWAETTEYITEKFEIPHPGLIV